MIIAEVCKYAPKYAGNFIDSLLSIESVAREKNMEVKLLFFFPMDAKNLGWVSDLASTHKVFFIPSGRIKENLFISKVCRKQKVDIVHVHFYGMVSSFLVGWITHAKVVNHFHNIQEDLSPLRKVSNILFSLSSKKLIGCSQEVMKTMLQANMPKSKCTYVTNCIDFKRLNKVKDAHPFDSRKVNLLILGTDFYRKGVDIALKAIQPIAKRYNIVLNIVSNLQADTKKKIKDIVGDDDSWIAFSPPTDNIGDYYRAADIFLSPSRSEGLSYAIIESMYCSCLVLKSDVPSMMYGLQGENSITLPLDVKEWRMKIEQLLDSDKDQRNAITTMYKSQVLKDYDVKKWGSIILSIYQETLEGHPLQGSIGLF